MSLRKNQDSPKGESIYLAIGFLRRPHGVMGEMIMDLHTDFPERIKTGRKVYLGDKHEAATIGNVRAHGDGLLIKIRGCDTPETAGRYRNHWVYVKSTEVPQLPAGQVYKYELVGLQVMDDENNLLGEVTEVLETGANDVYVVKNAEKEILLPAIPDVILKVDMESKVMTVHLIDGLIS
ncbi:MAG: 16S rRNA processing protein RimM [Anaerolineales bacterium]|nr:16S rRNA processing protein RimM [Anaerolineales bacterium]